MINEEIKLTRAAKIPYVDQRLYDRIQSLIKNNKKQSMLKTYARKSTILPSFIGFTIHVHNGKGFVPVTITENHVGFKLGEFAATRKHTYKAPVAAVKKGVKK